MKILHIINSIDIKFGGPSKSVSDLGIKLAQNNIEITILANDSKNPYLEVSPHSKLILNMIRKTSFKQVIKANFKNYKFDIHHIQGLWSFQLHKVSKLSRDNDIPYIISPRGSIEPWALNAGKWKKKLAMWLYQYNDLANANCIHATSSMEASNIRKLGFKNPIATIPNGIDLTEYPLPINRIKKEKYTLLFLSRIHPKKGIELLIQAWEQLDKKLRHKWQVTIIGNGENSYLTKIQELIINKHLENEIKLIGPQFGADKLKAYNSADLFVLPTYSENFGIVVAEALACGIPVITTTGTPWEELNTQNAGWWIEIGIDPLVIALRKAIQLNDAERIQMGLNGRKLIEEHYSIESVAQKMLQLYDWTINDFEKPEFVN